MDSGTGWVAGRHAERTEATRVGAAQSDAAHGAGSPSIGGEVDSLLHRRTVIGELGDALRILVEQSAATEAPIEELRRAAEEIHRVAALLGERVRGRTELPSADDLLGGVRMYNPVSGAGSALAPPLHIDATDPVVIGRCTLGLAFEGPPMYAHGGVSALLLDQMLGYAVGASGNPGMTVRLDTAYRAPVPLVTPLLLTAEVTGVEGRRVSAYGTIATAAEPDEPLVTATGTFIALGAEQAQRLFGPVLSGDAGSGSR